MGLYVDGFIGLYVDGFIVYVNNACLYLKFATSNHYTNYWFIGRSSKGNLQVPGI